LWLREVTDIDTAIEAGFADLDGYPDIGGNRWSGDCGRRRGHST